MLLKSCSLETGGECSVLSLTRQGAQLEITGGDQRAQQQHSKPRK